MSLKLNVSELEKILELFYELSGIRIVVFDENFCELLAYPKEKCPFCKEIHSHPELSEICDICDRRSFEECRRRKDIYIYKCHIGLVEATIPLIQYNQIIGYVMFGQITDIKEKKELERFVSETNRTYNIHCTTKKLKYRSKEQINAAAKLMEICTEYILLKEMIVPENSKIIIHTKEYIEKHLGEHISVAELCRHARTGRTGLYRAFSREYGMGIAAYIRKRRLEYAYQLLQTTELSIAEISDQCGFSDYNYFSRVFKKEYGISPHHIRN